MPEETGNETVRRLRSPLPPAPEEPDPLRRRLALPRPRRLQRRSDAACRTARRSFLCRVEDRRGHSHLCAARSANGIDHWVVDAQPTLLPDPTNYPEEMWGIEDPRITFVEELGKYAVAYTAFGRNGPGVALALTTDFKTFERRGVVMQPEDKDAALLPRRINGSFVLIHRPVTESSANIWVSLSPDLTNWGSHRPLLVARKGAWWDANKIGLSPPPIETPEGWLVLYHGVRNTCAGALYRLGVALFDKERFEHCIARGGSWIFGPEEPYECPRRRRERGVSLRPHDRRRWRHHQHVLRRSRHLDGAGHRQHPTARRLGPEEQRGVATDRAHADESDASPTHRARFRDAPDAPKFSSDL